MAGSYRASAVERALRSLVRGGPDGVPSEQEMAALRASRSETLPALADKLATVEAEELVAAIRLARLLEAAELAEDIAAAALRRPAPLEVKTAAVEALRALGVDVPPAVQETLELARAFVRAPDLGSLERVLALPEAWRLPVIDAWLAGGRVPEASLLERVLGVDPTLDEYVVLALAAGGSTDAAELLRDLAERTESKAMRKLARRGLHRLRSLGVEVEEERSGEPEFSLALDADPLRESRAWITGVDGAGGRIAWILTPSPSGGDRLLEVVLDDTEGVRKAELMAVTRKGFRSHLDKLRGNPGILIARDPVTRTAARLREARERSAAASRELPDDYREWERAVGDRLLQAAPPGTPELPVLDAVDIAAVRADRDLLQRSVDLLGRPYFANWALSGPVTESAARAVRRAETSDLVLDEEQRKKQVDEAIAGAADAFDDELRARYRRRLEDMADILWSLHEEEAARLALAAAAGFTEVADLYSAHPFARALVQRGVLVAYQAVRETEEQSSGESRIARP